MSIKIIKKWNIIHSKNDKLVGLTEKKGLITVCSFILLMFTIFTIFIDHNR